MHSKICIHLFSPQITLVGSGVVAESGAEVKDVIEVGDALAYTGIAVLVAPCAFLNAAFGSISN